MTSARWRFFRAGGFDQVRLDTGADVARLPDLDPKLWVALSSPTKGLEFDPHTLQLLDQDADGRIRVADVLAAVKWVTRLLKDPNVLTRESATLPLSAIDDSTEEGKVILASARQILLNLGRELATEISTADTVDSVRIFSKTTFNGDGIVPPESAPEESTRAAIRDIMECHGKERDLNGLDGVNQAKVDAFFTEANAYVQWWKKGEHDPMVWPLGDKTPEAYDALEAVRARVDDYFLRAQLAAMDPSAAAALNPSAEEYRAFATGATSEAGKALERLPLAHVEADRPLPLDRGVNPAFAGLMTTFRLKTVEPILGERASLTPADWRTLTDRLAPRKAWLAQKPAGAVEKLGWPRLRALVEGTAKGDIESLIAQDKALEAEAKAIGSVDKLVHFVRDLHLFLNNFVSFRDFYTRRARAMFQAGTLYLDGRSCDLVLRVEDPARHGTLATQSMMYLAYCDCVRKGGDEKMSIVAAFTNGDSDFLLVGRNGVFYDRKGQEWDATITKVLSQPISIREAFFAPYKRVAAFVGDQVEKLAAAKDKEAAEKLQAHAAVPATLPAAAPAGAPLPAAPAPSPAAGAVGFDIARFAGIFAAIGLALGAIGSAVAAVVTGFLGLTWWQMPLAVAGALLVVSGPSMLLAAAKLRRRNLGPLLDANGWAINARARINIPFGGSLTHLAQIPPGSERSLVDPYAEHRSRWVAPAIIVLLLAAGLYALHALGLLAKWIPALER